MKRHLRFTALLLLSLVSACSTGEQMGSNKDPLCAAVEAENTQEVRRLLAAGADVNARDRYSATPLHYAASLRQKALAELLIAKGADINAKSNEGVTPLYVTANRDRAEVAELLIARGAEVDARTTQGYTPLIKVAHLGNRDFVELLIAHGADVNAKDINGRTPLIWALITNDLASSLRQISQLDAARQQEGQKEIQKRFQLSAAGYEEIQNNTQKMKGQWLEVTKLLIDHGADITADLKKEGSLLYLAANLGSKDLVEALIDHGADINDAKTGETALQGAIAERHRDMAELLINKGADVTVKNSRSGRTPLHYLAFYIDDRKLAESMIKRGADINASDKNGETPLTFATRAGNNQVAKFLRERGGK